MFPLVILAIENDDDREYITELYVQYYSIMKKTAYQILRNYDIVDDLINEAFLKLIEKISTLRALECCKRTSYIVYTIRNISIDYIKHRTVETKMVFMGMEDDLMDSIPDTANTPEEISAAKETYEELGAAIETLSERDRDLLYCKYNLELKEKEIAEVMNIPVNNIRQYLVRARRRALKTLNERGLQK
ncbi:RNA polymerase, sigma-24 subunit, ECF subfamily [Syntrophobotulus glycolicus DSM 8271]|uniref:RNA polymerase, sigma-24 subunit, ECF subfamily n=1 Tax=Syntrophobotulus glycolicus (strain DSM 8271 / FlGlyR) TaxID=645991 RepID=F0SXV7_SYNGF|nr:sigma-70 family RNA polymerase sigma factor [Syntrophobotulus glycolicus]ADY57018.1 RNA polymerase, sigma-24 subunit, ECF subfamily [Syntrophobotulus glycolicus DSM 8271]